jgi:hypothetical protein
MGTNGGDKDNNSTAVSGQEMCWDGDNMDEVPVVQGLLQGGGLRGMEANTAESKGSPTVVPAPSGPLQNYGEPGGVLDECT